MSATWGRSRSGRSRATLADAAAALERLVPMDVLGLKPGRQRYGLFTDAAGGILDDLMFANRGDHLLLVVNAACKAADLAHLEAGLGDAVRGRAAGPGAAGAAGAEGRGGAGRAQPGRRGHALHGRARARARRCAGGGVALGLYRRGRLRDLARRRETRGDLAERLLASPEVLPVGLGARDSLRLEAGLCLYGHDIDAGTTPVEAALEWAIQPARRRRRRAGGRLSRRRRDPRADRRGGGAAPGRAAARGAGADARGDRAFRRRGGRAGRAG